MTAVAPRRRGGRGTATRARGRRCSWRMCLAGLLLARPVLAQAPVIGPEARYADGARRLETFIAHEMRDKGIPGLSIALVDDQQTVWARGFGWEDSTRGTAATAQTVYRVGSVSKLFTDVAVMQLVERGILDLDAPVQRYLPAFRPRNPSGRPITLRALMSHRAGLVREPPVGHYMDPSGPSLARTVASLNGTTLVYPPGERTKYSNAAIAVVGDVLEVTQHEPFARYLARAVLKPLGMRDAGFALDDRLRAHLARGTMWTRHGRTFDAPGFPLGMAPAGSMYATMPSLGMFLSALFAGGQGSDGPVLRRETLDAMWTPQFAQAATTTGYGLGFALGALDGERVVHHGGAIYGFATELYALPDAKFGVAVSASKDVANAVTTRIAEYAARLMLAARQGRELPPALVTTALSRAEAQAWAGRYGAGAHAVDLVARDSVLYLAHAAGGMRTRLQRLAGDTLVVDDVGDFGTRVVRAPDAIVVAGDTLPRAAPGALPPPPHASWRGLIGEYGWDHNTLYILEQDGRLTALIEWFFAYPLTPVSRDEFAFPDQGLYAGERLRFTRDANGRATRVVAGTIPFARRRIPGEDAAVFRITPVKPVDQLRRAALAASPPPERGTFRASDLVELVTLDSTIRLDIRYATTNDFLGVPVYRQARAFLQRPAAEALVRAHRALASMGYGLLIHDGYRPWYVTKMFWDGTPPSGHMFVADPSQGSRHNRGCAVDLTLYELATGRPVRMTGGYDEMTDRSYPDYPGGTSRQRALREILRRAMEAEGFSVYEAEWWHFDYRDWRSYAIGNQTFESLGQPR
jgi:CubicO group peptidase (beta-lactamase class C family)/D-alanyl-D-alanine dipeptidase